MNDTPQKTLLFCPSCWHESPPTGDWERERRDEGLAIVCPNCESTVTIRPPADARVPIVAN